MRGPRIFDVCTGPRPHPAAHGSILEWVAGWGRGPAPRILKQSLTPGVKPIEDLLTRPCEMG
jgi:hypothetical protein